MPHSIWILEANVCVYYLVVIVVAVCVCVYVCVCVCVCVCMYKADPWLSDNSCIHAGPQQANVGLTFKLG